MERVPVLRELDPAIITQWVGRFVEDEQRALAEALNELESLAFGLWLHALGFSLDKVCLLYTSPSPRDRQKSRMPSSA